MATDSAKKAKLPGLIRPKVRRPTVVHPFRGLSAEDLVRKAARRAEKLAKREALEQLQLQVDRDYAGRWVAWSWGHDRVVASGVTFPEAKDEVIRLGNDPDRVSYQWVEPYPRPRFR